MLKIYYRFILLKKKKKLFKDVFGKIVRWINIEKKEWVYDYIEWLEMSNESN